MTDQASPAAASTATALRQVLEQRFSCRGFLPQPVARDTVDEILRMAQRTPSWCNAQPWQVLVAAPAATQRLRAALLAAGEDDTGFDIPPPAEYRGVYRERRRETGLQLYRSVGVAPGDRVASARQAMENFRLFGAPQVAIVTTEPDLGVYGVLDCGAWVNNFMLAARSLGVACIAQAALASKAPVLRRCFDIPAERQVVCGVAFGYEDPDHPANQFRTARAGLQDAVEWVES